MDDIIIFAKVDDSQALIVHECLARFCNVSRHKVSLAKSRVYFSNNTSQDSKESIYATLGSESTGDLGMYFGIPTLTSRVTRDTFSHLCEKLTVSYRDGKLNIYH